MYALLLIALFGLNQPNLVQQTSVDWIEFNHYHDQAGKLVFKQIIFWERRYVRERPKCWKGKWQPWQDVVVDWRIVSRWPTPYRRADKWYVMWLDGHHEQEDFRRVSCGSVIVTWTQHDPEVINRRVWPTSSRRGL